MKKAELEAEVARLQKILDDHFTQMCDRCGRVGLCEPEATWDSFLWVCLDDKEGCDQRYRERLRIEREGRERRRNDGDLGEAMKAYYNKALLEQARQPLVEGHLNTAMKWHKWPE